jgi:hypothetical protein
LKEGIFEIRRHRIDWFPEKSVDLARFTVERLEFLHKLSFQRIDYFSLFLYNESRNSGNPYD